MPATLTLSRFCTCPEMGTFGRLRLADKEWFSVERPWLENRKSESCIPTGTYALKLGMFYRGDGVGGRPDYPAYEVLDVPDRTHIKIHVANTMHDVEGCIGPGLKLGTVGKSWAVRDSTIAYDQFMRTMKQYDVTTLVISWAIP